jgi:hypothetical protein
MKKVLFLQSWYSQITDNWYLWLKTELEKKGYITIFPDIPEMRKDVPDMKKILSYIESLGVLDEDTTIIAHSLGCLLAMRLAESHPYKSMILVSGWDFDDLYENHKLFWETKIDHEKIKNNVKNIFVVHSDNDPFSTAFCAEEMSKRLGGKFFLIKNGKHFTSKDGFTEMPILLEILALQQT